MNYEDKIGGWEGTKPVGRPKGPKKVVYKRRVLPEDVERLDGLLSMRREEVDVKKTSIIPIEVETAEVLRLRAEVELLRKKVKEFETMYS